WTAWLGLVLAGVLMLGFLRGEGLGAGAALLGAVTFAWSGTLSARLHLFMHYDTLLWLPGMLWAASAIARGGGAGAVLGRAGATAGAWTGGFAPSAVTMSLAAGAWWLCRVASVAR